MANPMTDGRYFLQHCRDPMRITFSLVKMILNVFNLKMGMAVIESYGTNRMVLQ